MTYKLSQYNDGYRHSEYQAKLKGLMDELKPHTLCALSQDFSEKTFEIVALAASAGGLSAISNVLKRLPANFPVAIAIVQHLAPAHPSLMAEILSRKTSLQVKQAEEGEPITVGSVYIAPPNHHLLVNPDKTLSVTQTERIHFLRPSADLLFNSIAATYQDRAIAVVLSGTGNDGAMGVEAINRMGGTTIAQDEETSEFFGMPSAAIQTGIVDFVLPLSQIADVLMSLVRGG
jgi:two-component system, chemotaxis family, protein-glutamate methylesterase/glutaminase